MGNGLLVDRVESYKSCIKPWAVKTVLSCSNILLKEFYDIYFNDNHALDNLRHEGFVLLPKHRRWLDILLTGIFLQKTVGRQGHYVMKQSLPSILKYLGGMPVYREKEMNKMMVSLLKDKRDYSESDARRIVASYAKLNNDSVKKTLVDLLFQDQILVIYPEAAISDLSGLEIKIPVIRNLLHLQEKYFSKTGKPIPFVPLSIEYALSRSEILLNAAEPIIEYGLSPKEFGELLKQRVDSVRTLV